MRQKQHKKNVFIIISYIVLIAMVPFSLLFSHWVGGSMDEHIHDTLQNSTELCAEIIHKQYESDLLMLEGLAMRMSATLESNVDEGIYRMVSTASRYGMKRISFSTPDGNTYSTDGAVMDLTGIPTFETALTGTTLLTPVMQDVMDNQEINVYSTPVYKENSDEIIGVLSAVYYSETFRELLSTYTFDGEGYTYIIDKKGNVVVNTAHPNAFMDLESNNIFEHMDEHHNSVKNITQVRLNLQNAKDGFFEATGARGTRLVYYMPLEINDWFVISAVPKSVASATKRAIMTSIAIFCISASLISIYVLVSIQHSQREKYQLLKKAFYEDSLTGGRSYEKFKIDCQEQLKYSLNPKAIFGVLGIDNFNLIATLYGNEESNKVLCQIYEIIQFCVGEKGYICRSGFSQFCILYFYDDLNETEALITKFNKMLHKNTLFDNMLRPALGLYVVEDREESVADMLNKARIALDTIKQNQATSHVAYYDESFRNALYEDRHLEDEMEIALERHEFVPYFQPKYDTQTMEIRGAEALIRWITPDGNLISPGKFIPLAENNGFIRQLDREMFSMVCHFQKKLLDRGMTPVPVSVNVSRQLMYDKRFADDYYNLTQELNLPPGLIELEITESIFFEDLHLFHASLEKLRQYGFRILMDDFGTGYSSLMMLKTMPIDEIKLDKTFVDDYNDPKGRDIIKCVLDLSKRLGMPVVAEGVETKEQYLYFKAMDCELLQGYYFSRPLPPEDYVQKLS